VNSTEPEGDLGFSIQRRKNGELQVLHHGRLAATLRGEEAASLLDELATGSHADGQQLMARLTGNYKRGNERKAQQHPRNQRD
jgi:hypothetical protein